MPKITCLIALLLLSSVTQQVGLRSKSNSQKDCIKREKFSDGSEGCVEYREKIFLNNFKNGGIQGTNERVQGGPLTNIGSNETVYNTSFLQTELNNAPDVRYNKINSKPYITGYSVRGGSKYMAGSDVPNILNTVGDKLVDNIKYNHDEPPYMYDKPPVVELGMLTAQIAAGGRIARKALLRLNTLANHVGMDKYIRSFLPIALACKSLIIREQEDVNVKMLCGSLYSRITDTPVTTQYADISNGTDYGKVSTIVMPRPSRIYRPDKEVQKLREGADLLHILDDKPLEYYDD